MEHEVYVPFPVGTVWQAFGEAERVARCVPGIQLDTDAAPHRPEGRLRLRIGGSTITYRGALSVNGGPEGGLERDPVSGPENGPDDGAGDGPDGSAAGSPGDGGEVGPVTIEASGTEIRGDGAVAVTLTVRLVPASEPGPGTTLVCNGTVRSEGRLAAADGQAAETAGRRLLDRFAENLAADLTDRPVAAAPEQAPGTVSQSIFDTEVPPPSLDPLSDAEDDVSVVADPDEPIVDAPDDAMAEAAFASDDEDGLDDALDDGLADGEDELNGPDELAEEPGLVPAEAAHARRTMIGRSAEEVDHAPPRGRYAPVPAPEPGGSSVPLRWAAPAAALVLASAVVVGRVLRRRR